MAASQPSAWHDIAVASLGLPDEKLLNVLTLIENAPARDEVQEVLDRIRPRIAQLRPPRQFTPQRLLFQPMEDLFDPPERYRPGTGRLSRQFVRPCWQIVHQLASEAVIETARGLPDVDQSNPVEVMALGLPLWQRAAVVLSDFLAEDIGIGRLPVGQDSVVITKDVRHQLLGGSEILSVAPQTETAKLHLRQRPVRALSKADRDLLKRFVAELGAVSTIKVRAFAAVMMARMTRPGDLLQLISEISLQRSDRERLELIKQMGSDSLFALADQARRLSGMKTDEVNDPARLALLTEELASGLASLERFADGSQRRSGTGQLQAGRRNLGSFVLDKLVVAADLALMRTLTDSVAEEICGDRAYEREKSLEDTALSLRRCARLADSVGVRKELEIALKSICERLERFGALEGGEPAARRHRLVLAVRLIEVLAGPDEAQRLLMSHIDTLESLAAP